MASFQTSSAQQEAASQAPNSLYARSLAMALVPSLLAAGGLTAQTVSEGASTPVTPAEGSDKDVVQLESLEVQDEREQNALSSPKYTQPLIDVPQTITVIPRGVFEQQGATTLRDVLRNTPGITFQAGEGGTANGDQMTIRGFDARTDITVDGIRDAGTYTRDAFNLEQVEVAKGPSSAQTGRGSTGANVNLVSKTPKLENFRTVTAGIGTDDYYRGTVDINQNLSPHATDAGTAFRLNVMGQDSGVAGRDYVKNRQWAVAPSLAFGLGTPTRITLSYLHLEQDNVPDYGLPWIPLLTRDTGSVTPGLGEPGGQPNVDRSNWYGLLERDYEDVESNSETVALEHDFTPDTTLRNTTRYTRTVRDSVITPPRFVISNPDGVADSGDGVVLPLVRRNDVKTRDSIDTSFANNTNLSTTVETGPVTHFVSTGIDLSRETSLNRTRAFVPNPTVPTSAYDPNPHDAFTSPLRANGACTDGEATDFGVYLFDTAELNEKWELNGGIRYDRYDADYTTVSAAPALTRAEFDRTDNMFSWKAGVVFKPRPNGSVFLGYGTSFNPSAEGLALTTATAELEPEESTSTELGTKWDLFNRRLSLSAALFRTDKTNARTTNPTTSEIELAGDQRVQGIELGAAGFITERWGLFAGYAYMDSEVRDSANATELGSALARTPENSFNVWTTYDFPAGLTLGAGMQYMDEVDRSTTTQNQVVPSFVVWNAMASYQVTKNLLVRLNVNNLFDEEYVDRVGGGHYIPGPTRSAILSAVYQF